MSDIINNNNEEERQDVNTITSTSTSSSSEEQQQDVIVNFVWSWANILSIGESLEDDCVHGNDASCQGGLATVTAWVRHYERLQAQQDPQEQQDPQAQQHPQDPQDPQDPQVPEQQEQNQHVVAQVAQITTAGGSLIIPRVDYQSAFSQMHPLQWAVNRFVFSNYYHWNTFFAYPSFLFQEDNTNSAVNNNNMQTHDWQPLLSNTNIAPANGWASYVQRVHLDPTTRLAVLSIDHPRQPLATPQLESAQGLLDYIHQLNVVNKCVDHQADESLSLSLRDFDDYVQTHAHLLDSSSTTTAKSSPAIFTDQNVTDGSSSSSSSSIRSSSSGSSGSGSFSWWTSNNNNTTTTTTTTTSATTGSSSSDSSSSTNSFASSKCWIPIIVYEESLLESFTSFVAGIANYQHPPSLIIDVRGNDPERYATPQLVGSSNTTWVVSYFLYYLQHYQQQINIRQSTNAVTGTSSLRITNVTLLQHDMSTIPNAIKDAQFYQDIAFTRQLANEAAAHNPIVGQTMPMSRSELESRNLRPCMGGECPLGNLFADAMAWKAATILFTKKNNANDSTTTTTTTTTTSMTNDTAATMLSDEATTNETAATLTLTPASSSSSTSNTSSSSSSSSSSMPPPVVIAFLNSGGIRGPGWAAGDVRISDLWQALPFANTMCIGKMTGLSLYKLFDYSMSMATFQSEYTINGDRLLQVSSSVRVTYNTRLNKTTTTAVLSSSPSRLVSIEVWNETMHDFEPLERLKLYPFATDSWMCQGFDPFPALLGSEMLVIPGEEPGVVHGGGLLSYQNVVAEYLTFRNATKNAAWYNTTIQGRLVNDTAGTVMASMIQTDESCRAGTYWKSNYLSCFDCPETPNVRFTTDNAAFSGISGGGGMSGIGSSSSSSIPGVGGNDDDLQYETTEIVNDESFPVRVALKSKPTWVDFIEPLNLQPFQPEDEKDDSDNVNADKDEVDPDKDDSISTTRLSIPPGGRLALSFTASAVDLEAGTAQESISFAVLDGGSFPGCNGQDIVLPVLMRVEKQPEVTTLGQVAIVGLSLTALAIVLTMIFCSWVHCYRERQVVKSMQPIFLMTLCFGIFAIAASIIPLSIADNIASSSGRDMSCMAFPWLLSLGFTITASTLYSKLWRINKLFNNGSPFRRQVVLTKDVLIPGAVLLALNLLTIVTWTIWDPLQYEIRQAEDVDWIWYGSCTSMGTPGKTLLGLNVAVNVTALFMACYQAYKARNISHNYSEVKHLAIALFGWVQILVVGIPVLFLIENDNRNARYLLTVLIIFLVSMSMMLIIFVPMMRQLRQTALSSNRTSSVRISGLDISAYQNNKSQGSGSVGLNTTTTTTTRNNASSPSHSIDFLTRQRSGGNNPSFGGGNTSARNNNLSPLRISLPPKSSAGTMPSTTAPMKEGPMERKNSNSSAGTTTSSIPRKESPMESKNSMDGSDCGTNNKSNSNKELASVLKKDVRSEVSEQDVQMLMSVPVGSRQDTPEAEEKVQGGGKEDVVIVVDRDVTLPD
jgi:7 transmembrane sweet-taste receptor of 3 GCPR/5'-nucleotidase, C-terminal domain